MTWEEILREVVAGMPQGEGGAWVERELARRCARAETDLARLVEAARVVASHADEYGKAWVRAHEKDDHLCNLDHKDEMDLADLVEECLALSSTLRSIEEKRDNPKENT